MHRQPVWTEEINAPCFSVVLKRYLNKLSPSQSRLFCQEAIVSMKSHYKTFGFHWDNAEMNSLKPLGENTVRNMFKKGAQMIGLEKFASFGGHSLRAYFITKLANNSAVNKKELMGTARHSSISAGLTYIQRNQNSEVACFRALEQFYRTPNPENHPEFTSPPYPLTPIYVTPSSYSDHNHHMYMPMNPYNTTPSFFR